MVLLIFLMAWLISPLVLLPLYLAKHSECNRFARQNRELLEQLKKLQSESSETDNLAQAAEQPQKTPENQAYNPYLNSLPYNLPQYNIPSNPVKNLPPEPKKSETAYAPPPVTAEKTPKKSVSTINIILILGALLISLSGFIFAVATWGVLNTFFKSVVLISFSAIFFAIHSVSERKLKLPQTGRVFYILGSIFLPSAVVAAGILKVFGEYFSFTGDGRAAVLAVIFLTVCIPFFKGAQDYKNRFFAAVSFYTFSAAAVSLIWQVSPNGSIVALAASVFALAIAILEPTAQKLFERLFGEDNVFSAEFSRFSAVNAWALSIVSLFAAESGFVSLAAFAIFSVCFLTKTVTDKGSTAGAIAFAFFITTSMFIGFDPGDFSDIICIIAATALICGVLSVMGIFPEALKKALSILGIAAAGITGLCAFLENTILFSSLEAPSPALVIALAAIFAELLIFALRYKTAYYKAMSFGAMLLLSSAAAQLILGETQFAIYTFAVSYAVVLAYFCAARFTRLRDRLYVPINDIILSVYAFWCPIILTLANTYTLQSSVISLAIIVSAIVSVILSNHEKIAPIICPILTFLSFFHIYDIFEICNISLLSGSLSSDSLAVIILLTCVIAAVLLFIKGAENYAKAYGIAAAVSVPLFIITSLADSASDFVPPLAVTVYTAFYLFKYAFPRGKYVQIHFLHGMILLTTIFVGVHCADTEYVIVMCFPSVAALMMFGVNIIGTSFGSFENTSKHTEHFLWYAMSALSGILLWTANEEGVVSVLTVGVILAVCALILSISRRNTMPLIFPILTGLYVIGDLQIMELYPVPALIFAIVIAVVGRLIFPKKLFSGVFSDIFSISAFPAAMIAYSKGVTDVWKWFVLLFMAALTANLMRSGQTSKSNRIILTITAAFLFPLWWTLPFFTVPDLIAVQFNLLPVVIFCVILRFIRNDALPEVYNFAFISAIVSLIVLFIDAMASGNNFDSIFIGVVLFIMLAVSFIIKKKRWFVLAVASMVVSAVLLSISRLDSIAWLVYLLIAGAALIALGVINELKKQQKKSGDDVKDTKLTRFMSDWKW